MPKKGSFSSRDFRYDKYGPSNVSNPAEIPGESWPICVSSTHRFCGGGLFWQLNRGLC